MVGEFIHDSVLSGARKSIWKRKSRGGQILRGQRTKIFLMDMREAAEVAGHDEGMERTLMDDLQIANRFAILGPGEAKDKGVWAPRDRWRVQIEGQGIRAAWLALEPGCDGAAAPGQGQEEQDNPW